MSVTQQTPAVASPAVGADGSAGGSAAIPVGETLPPAEPTATRSPAGATADGGVETTGDVGVAPAGAPLRIVAFGHPAPQGSKRHVGHGVMVESSKHVKPWREAVKAAARTEIDARPGWVPLDGPLVAHVVFTFTRPHSHYRTGRNAHLLKDSAPRQPCSPPDISKLLRATEDALTDAGVWRDDSRVCEYLRLAKVWAGEDVHALDIPGVRIEIRQVIP